MKMLLIHQMFNMQNDFGSTRHIELLKPVIKNDNTIIAIAGSVFTRTGKSRNDKKRIIEEENHGNLTIIRAYIPPIMHNNYISRILAFLIFSATSILGGLQAGKVDIVMGTSPPFFQAFSALLIAKLRRKPFLLEIRDLWPDFAIDMGLLKNKLLITLIYKIVYYLYSKANHIIVNSPAYAKYLIENGFDGKKITLIPNGVDPRLFAPEKLGEEIRKKYLIDDKFVVTYAGAFGMANDLDTLIKSAFLLKDDKDIHFLLIGGGKEQGRIEKMIKELGLSNVTIGGSVNKSKIPEILAASDACVAILKNIKMFSTTYPNKVFDYMAAGRPTILVIDGVIRQVIEDAAGGIFIRPGDPIALSDGIKYLSKHPSIAKKMGVNAREFVEKKFDRKKHAEEFEELIQGLCKHGTNRTD